MEKDTKKPINTQVNYSRSLLLLLLPLLPISLRRCCAFTFSDGSQINCHTDVAAAEQETWDHMRTYGSLTCQPTPASRRKLSEPSPHRRTAPGWLEKRLHAHKNSGHDEHRGDVRRTETPMDERGFSSQNIHGSSDQEGKWHKVDSCDSSRRLVVSGWFSAA